MAMEQIKCWSENFGEKYTDRNSFKTADAYNQSYIDKFGKNKDEINLNFLKEIDKSIRVLEVGCNRGNQLKALQRIGFNNLYGIDVQNYALEKARENLKANFIEGSALDIPYKDGFFGLVFTSNVLIHIKPDDINTVLDEIFRCSNRYIWGFEYYAEEYTEVPYRGHTDLLWKADFAQLFLKRFDDLTLIKEEKFSYLDAPDNVDSMYLLEKK